MSSRIMKMQLTTHLLIFGLSLLYLIAHQYSREIFILIYTLAALLVLLTKAIFFIDKISMIFILFLITLINSTFFSINPGVSIPVLFLYIAFYVLFTTSRLIFSSNQNQQLLALAIILSTLILSVVSLFNTIVLKYVNTQTLGISFMWIYFGHNYLSSLLVFSIPLSIHKILNTQNLPTKLFYLFACLIYLVSLYFTFSRGSIIALVISFYIAVLIFKIGTRKIYLSSLVILVIFILSFVLMRPIARNVSVVKTIDMSSSRIAYFSHAIRNGLSNPLTGTGLDTYQFIKFEDAKRNILSSTSAHNFFLQMLSDAGIPALISSSLLIFSILFKVTKKILGDTKDKLLISYWIGIFSSFILSLFDMTWQIPTVFLTFLVTSALILHYQVKTQYD